MSIENALVVHSRTAYERYCEVKRDANILQLVSQNHFTIQDLLKAHREHREAMDKVGTAFEALGVAPRFVRRADLSDTRGHDLIITIGGDGTFLAASHHVFGVPILGVNATPSESMGVFCGATSKTFKSVLAQVLEGKLKALTLNRVSLVLNGRTIEEPVLNEVLISPHTPAAVARYVIEVQRKKENHKSSGVYIGTAAGSTSVLHAAGGQVLPLTSKRVQWVVREPYIQRGPKPTLLKGIVPAKTGVKLFSKMRNGMLYIDGPDVRYRFDYGDELHVLPEGPPLTVLGMRRLKKKSSDGS